MPNPQNLMQRSSKTINTRSLPSAHKLLGGPAADDFRKCLHSKQTIICLYNCQGVVTTAHAPYIGVSRVLESHI